MGREEKVQVLRGGRQSRMSLPCSKQLLTPHLVLGLPVKACVWGAASLLLGE